MQSERLADQTFDAVAMDRIADRLRRDGKSQAGNGCGIRPDYEPKHGIAVTTALFISLIEVGFATQTLRRSEAILSRQSAREIEVPVDVTPRDAYVPSHDGEPEPGGRSWWPCERGNRAYACDADCWADKCASSKFSLAIIAKNQRHGGSRRRAARLRRHLRGVKQTSPASRSWTSARSDHLRCG